MLEFLINNFATIFVSAVVLAVVILILVKLRRDKNKGGACSSCGSGCDSCACSSMCHKE